MAIDWEAAKSGKRPVHTEDRTHMRVLCTDAPGRWPAICMDASGDLYRFGLDGEHINGTDSQRLIQEPEVIEIRLGVTLSILKESVGNVCVWGSWDEAREHACSGEAIIPITITKRGDKIVIHGESE